MDTPETVALRELASIVKTSSSLFREFNKEMEASVKAQIAADRATEPARRLDKARKEGNHRQEALVLKKESALKMEAAKAMGEAAKAMKVKVDALTDTLDDYKTAHEVVKKRYEESAVLLARKNKSDHEIIEGTKKAAKDLQDIMSFLGEEIDIGLRQSIADATSDTADRVTQERTFAKITAELRKQDHKATEKYISSKRDHAHATEQVKKATADAAESFANASAAADKAAKALTVVGSIKAIDWGRVVTSGLKDGVTKMLSGFSYAAAVNNMKKTLDTSMQRNMGTMSSYEDPIQFLKNQKNFMIDPAAMQEIVGERQHLVQSMNEGEGDSVSNLFSALNKQGDSLKMFGLDRKSQVQGYLDVVEAQKASGTYSAEGMGASLQQNKDLAATLGITNSAAAELTKSFVKSNEMQQMLLATDKKDRKAKMDSINATQQALVTSGIAVERAQQMIKDSALLNQQGGGSRLEQGAKAAANMTMALQTAGINPTQVKGYAEAMQALQMGDLETGKNLFQAMTVNGESVANKLVSTRHNKDATRGDTLMMGAIDEQVMGWAKDATRTEADKKQAEALGRGTGFEKIKEDLGGSTNWYIQSLESAANTLGGFTSAANDAGAQLVGAGVGSAWNHMKGGMSSNFFGNATTGATAGVAAVGAGALAKKMFGGTMTTAPTATTTAAKIGTGTLGTLAKGIPLLGGVASGAFDYMMHPELSMGARLGHAGMVGLGSGVGSLVGLAGGGVGSIAGGVAGGLGAEKLADSWIGGGETSAPTPIPTTIDNSKELMVLNNMDTHLQQIIELQKQGNQMAELIRQNQELHKIIAAAKLDYRTATFDSNSGRIRG